MKDSNYLNRVRALPCVVCEATFRTQKSLTTAHHCFHDRLSRVKVSDYDVIPLCDAHHQGLWGTDPDCIAIHKQKKTWREKHGPDWSYINLTRKRAECPSNEPHYAEVGNE